MRSQGSSPRLLVRGKLVQRRLVCAAAQNQVHHRKGTPPPLGGGVIGHGRSQDVAIPWPLRHSRRVVIGGVPASLDKLQEYGSTLPPATKNPRSASPGA